MAFGSGLVVAVLLHPPVHPRTPVLWPEDTACMTVVDRSESSILHLEYAIDFEDTILTEEELADSRRHRFVALCKGHAATEWPPTWLSWQDVDRAIAGGLLDPGWLTDEDVLETSSEYAACFERITADADRRPITFAAAAEGVDWDTAALAPGPYVVQGYTWEPAINVWWSRPGVVHVVDDLELDVAPAAALMNQDRVMIAGDGLTLEGCVRAAPGSTLSGYWAVAEEELDWRPFVTGVPVEGETITLPFTPPPEAMQQRVVLRVDVTDPAQRTFSAPMRTTLLVVENDPSADSCGGFLACDEQSSEGSEGSEGAGSGSEGAADPMMTSGTGGDGGCACRAGEGGATGAAGLVMLVGLAMRRRKRGSTLGAV